MSVAFHLMQSTNNAADHLVYCERFTAELASPEQLDPNRPYILLIRNQPRPQTGDVCARLELKFRSSSGQTFHITSVIRATFSPAGESPNTPQPVALQQAAPQPAAPQPVAPPLRAPRRAPRLPPVTNVIVGPPNPFATFSTIPYVTRLPPYPFDEAVAVEGSLGHRLAVIQSLLPESLNNSEYGRFWSVLLFAEEHQLRYVSLATCSARCQAFAQGRFRSVYSL